MRLAMSSPVAAALVLFAAAAFGDVIDIEGTLALTNNTASRTYRISSPVEIPSGSTATFHNNKNSTHIELAGAVTGEGKIVSTTADGKTSCGMVFSGDMSGFRGTAECTVADNAATHCFISTNMSGSAWKVFDTGKVGAAAFPFQMAGATFSFGALDMRIPNVSSSSAPSGQRESDFKNVTIEVGALDQDSKIRGSFNSTADMESVRWVAPTATLNYWASNTYALEVTGGGVLSLGNMNNGIPSNRLSFKGAGGYITGVSAVVNDGSLLSKITGSDAMIGFLVESDKTNTLTAARMTTLMSGNSFPALGKRGEGLLEVPEGTLFTNLTAEAKLTIGIVGSPGEKVSFRRDAVTGCEMVVLADAGTTEIYVAADTVDRRTSALSATGDVEKTGEGTLVLVGSSDFGGSLTVSAGTLRIEDDDGTPEEDAPIPATADVIVEGGATLDFGELSPNMRSLTLKDGAIIAVDALPPDMVFATTECGIEIEGSVTLIVGGSPSSWRLCARDGKLAARHGLMIIIY